MKQEGDEDKREQLLGNMNVSEFSFPFITYHLDSVDAKKIA